MKKVEITKKRAPVLLGSARKLTKGGPIGDQDEPVLGGRYFG